MEKRWRFYPKIPEEILQRFPEIPPIILQLLHNRNITTQKEIDEFLNCDYGLHIYDPFLFSDMEKAVKRILQAVIKKERVLIYGDYDADGVCAAVIMTELFELFQLSPDIYIPYRETEGYGLNMSAVKEIIQNNIQLVITVDCGIGNVQEVQALQNNHIDVIITDHHNPLPNIPEAFAIINPKLSHEKYPIREICGTSVVYKVIQAVLSEKTRNAYRNILTFPIPGYEKWMLDLVAIGTITDLIHLIGESRTLTKYGLVVLNKTRRIGLRSLFQEAGIQLGNINTNTVGFQIGPRLNAAGRMDHASTSYQLLIEKDINQAQKLAHELNAKNIERQKITDLVFRNAMEQVRNQLGDTLLFAKNESWPPSIVGLVAGKISECYHRPVIVVGRNAEGRWVGSGRSIPEFDITSALKECSSYFEKYGGHSQACGFSLKNGQDLHLFKTKIKEIAARVLQNVDLSAEIPIDAEVELHEIQWDLLEYLEKFQPFGQGNWNPVFLIRQCRIIGCNAVGKNGNHLKGVIGDGKGTTRQIIGFQLGEWAQKLKPADRVDILCHAEINEWNGNREIQLKIIDLKPSNDSSGIC